MQSGSLAGGDVRALTSRVFVDNIERAHESWSVARDIVGDLPEQVVAGGGIRQATGSITWAEQPDVTGTAANPWNSSAGWLPQTGQIVSISVSDGITEWIQFRGVIDETTGDVGDSPQSSVIDCTDYLNQPFHHPTVLRLHPPKSEGAAYLGVGMTPAYLVDQLFRGCGFTATPSREPNSVMSAPMQTSMWPEWGDIVSAGSVTGGGITHGINNRAPWGWCMSDFTATYNPYTTVTRTDPVQLTCMVAPDHTGSFTLDANYGTGKIRLWINTGRSAVAMLDGVEVCRLTLGAGTVVTLLVKGGAWTVKNNLGASISGTTTLPAGSDLTTVTLTGDANSRIAGVQVSKPTPASEFQSLSYGVGYYQETAQLTGLMDVLPSTVDRTVIDLLTEISKATLSPFWFNEQGVLSWYGSDVLRSRAPVQTVTTLDDITKLSWTDSRLGMRSTVAVKYKFPALNRSRYSSVMLWQGSGETMTSGEQKAMFAQEPSDEDWVEIDDFTVSNAGSLTAFNQGRGTWIGAYLEDASGAWTSATGYDSWTLQTIDDETRLFNVTVGTLPAGKTLVLGTPDDATNYFPRMRGIGMPILRGRARVKWADLYLSSAITGPAGFPALEHDGGVWSVQTANTTIQTRLADFIAAQVTAPSPTITGMEVVYDPRRQLGDVITISSPALLGIELTALIVGVRNSAGDSYSQSLDVRIITKKSTYATYAEYDKTLAGTGLTYAQWQALGPLPQTYKQFNDAA